MKAMTITIIGMEHTLIPSNPRIIQLYKIHFGFKKDDGAYEFAGSVNLIR
jgi:hypothetical protein